MKKILIFCLLIIVVSCKQVRKEYYPNGKVKSEGQFKEGRWNGYFKEYYKNGNIKVSSFFNDGKQTGLTKVYYENGELDRVLTYEDDLLQGKSIFYYQDGGVKMESISNDDETVFFKRFDQQGNLLKEWRFVEINVVSDTIDLNGVYNPHLKLYGPISNDTILFDTKIYYYGDSIVPKNRKTIEGWKTITSVDGEADYHFSPDSEGVFQIGILVFMGKNEEKAFWGERYFWVTDKLKK